MSKRFIKIFKKFDVKEIEKHLMLYGALAGHCGNCQEMDLKLEMRQCPKCKTDFKYLSFKNIKDHLPKMLKLHEQYPDLIFVDHDDFKRLIGAIKAEEFLK